MGSKELETKINILVDKNKALSASCRGYRRRIKELASSRDLWKSKYCQEKEKCRVLSRDAGRGVSLPPLGKRIERHKYCDVMVGLCLNICILGCCSLRGCVRILSYLRLELGMLSGELPCKSSVSNWIKKAGYHVKSTFGPDTYKGGYALIIDECMVIGHERMLCLLAIEAGKTGCEPLRQCSVSVAAIVVRPSWKGEQISELLQKVEEKMGSKPAYIVSDGSSNLVAGIEKFGVPRVCDVAHEVGRLMEQVYKADERYIAFSKAMSQCRLKEVMKASAYLMPPQQRTVARFMNLSPCMVWAQKMGALLADPARSLSEAERAAFAWVEENKDIIQELGKVQDLSSTICNILKNNGLSKKSISQCREWCAKFSQTGSPTQARWVAKIQAYMEGEDAKIQAYIDSQAAKPTGKDVCWHASSDIIESMFGSFKARKADNPLHGVTSYALIMPLLTRISQEGIAIEIDIKEALESVLLSDIKQWEEDDLIENQVVRRNKIFRK